jgi:hypothetical protein
MGEGVIWFLLGFVVGWWANERVILKRRPEWTRKEEGK